MGPAGDPRKAAGSRGRRTHGKSWGPRAPPRAMSGESWSAPARRPSEASPGPPRPARTWGSSGAPAPSSPHSVGRGGGRWPSHCSRQASRLPAPRDPASRATRRIIIPERGGRGGKYFSLAPTPGRGRAQAGATGTAPRETPGPQSLRGHALGTSESLRRPLHHLLTFPPGRSDTPLPWEPTVSPTALGPLLPSRTLPRPTRRDHSYCPKGSTTPGLHCYCPSCSLAPPPTVTAVIVPLS